MFEQLWETIELWRAWAIVLFLIVIGVAAYAWRLEAQLADPRRDIRRERLVYLQAIQKLEEDIISLESIIENAQNAMDRADVGAGPYMDNSRTVWSGAWDELEEILNT